MIKRINILVFALLAALTAQGQIFYKITGNGLAKPSYLFGTHHLAPLSVADSLGVEDIIASVDMVVGEIDMTQDKMAMAMQMQPHMVAPADSTLSKVFGKEKMDLYSPIFSKYAPMSGMTLNMLDPMKPMVVNAMVMMGMIQKMMPNFKEGDQLDTYFQQIAQKRGRIIVPLETAEQQAIILYDSTPIAEQAESLSEIFENPEEAMENARILNNAYAKGDLDAMYKLSKSEDVNPEFFDKLLFKRNAEWMKKLPSIINKGSAFIGVGALHLAGEKGLIEELRKLGYTVTPVK